MAYSSVRVQFEIGHEASVRTKKTPDGFTHDWEVFVKGADNTDIKHFVDKVVFHLHETFPKPRRVIKDPPYVVKESGYAGFVLPIDVYLKNKEEPKKISFQYDLTLQNSGPPISRVLREPRVFQNPSEDFRRKLIRGGGVGVDTPNEIPVEDHKSSSNLNLNKSKPTESPSRKHKPELKLNDSFAELFGPPIKRVTPEPKKASDLLKLAESEKHKKKPVKPDKEEKIQYKEKDKYADRDRTKERDKGKDKGTKSQTPQIIKPKEEHKKLEEKERKKEDNEEKKKKKEDRDKKEKYKDNKNSEKDSEREIRKEKKESKNNDYIKKLNALKSSENKSSDKNSNDLIEKERSDKEKHKHRHKKKEKEKSREKERHKKDKDKHDRDSRERNKDKDKVSKSKHDDIRERDERIRKKSPTSPPVQEKIKKGPLDALLVELRSSDSASPLSEDDDSIPPLKLTPPKVLPESRTQNVVNMSPKLKSTNLNSSLESRAEKDIEKHSKSDESNLGKNKRDKSPGKKNKKNDFDSEKKRLKEHKRRSTSTDREKDDDEIEKPRREIEEIEIFDRDQAEKERVDDEKSKSNKKEKDSSRKRKREKTLDQSGAKVKDIEVDNSVGASQALDSVTIGEDVRKAEKFTKEYVAQLRGLQNRIMTLEDNDDLQKVVQIIAETGQYEITKKTFDFDLCALDSDTIRRLQEFFSPT